jgi:DNA-binding NarL/FixJ family response regulator
VAKILHEIKKGMQKAKQLSEDREIIVTKESEQAGKNEDPWNKSPDSKWDRKAVKMLWEGNKDPEIANELNVVSKTVTNKLSSLRQQYPDLVPTRDELRKKKLN